MEQGRVVPLDGALAMTAAKLSAELRLPMADSIILATAREFGAVLWTQDADFDGWTACGSFPRGSGS
jgi:toxin FitB